MKAFEASKKTLEAKILASQEKSKREIKQIELEIEEAIKSLETKALYLNFVQDETIEYFLNLGYDVNEVSLGYADEDGDYISRGGRVEFYWHEPKEKGKLTKSNRYN